VLPLVTMARLQRTLGRRQSLDALEGLFLFTKQIIINFMFMPLLQKLPTCWVHTHHHVRTPLVTRGWCPWCYPCSQSLPVTCP